MGLYFASYSGFYFSLHQNFAAQYDHTKGSDPGPGPMVNTHTRTHKHTHTHAHSHTHPWSSGMYSTFMACGLSLASSPVHGLTLKEIHPHISGLL